MKLVKKLPIMLNVDVCVHFYEGLFPPCDKTSHVTIATLVFVSVVLSNFCNSFDFGTEISAALGLKILIAVLSLQKCFGSISPLTLADQIDFLFIFVEIRDRLCEKFDYSNVPFQKYRQIKEI